MPRRSLENSASVKDAILFQGRVLRGMGPAATQEGTIYDLLTLCCDVHLKKFEETPSWRVISCRAAMIR